MVIFSYWLWQTIKIYQGLGKVVLNLKVIQILDKSKRQMT